MKRMLKKVLCIKCTLKSSICLFVCLSVGPQFLTDIDQSWYKAALGTGEDQGQFADAFGQDVQCGA